MIGQFVARFIGGLKVWKLCLALLIVPSVPIAIWFSVLYYYFSNGLEIGTFWRLAMVVVGVIFVINSLDSLIRLYTQNLRLTTDRVSSLHYVAGNWFALSALVMLYKFTPLKIEWIGADAAHRIGEAENAHSRYQPCTGNQCEKQPGRRNTEHLHVFDVRAG